MAQIYEIFVEKIIPLPYEFVFDIYRLYFVTARYPRYLSAVVAYNPFSIALCGGLG